MMLGGGRLCMKMSHKILPNYHNNLIIFIELSFMTFLSSFIQDTNTQMHATTGHPVYVSIYKNKINMYGDSTKNIMEFNYVTRI